MANLPPNLFRRAAMLALLPALAAMAATALAQTGVTRSAFHTSGTVITSARQLETYLRNTPPTASPLNLLTPGARQRFLASLTFGERGLSGLALDDLGYDLTPAEAADVLALFGAQQYAPTIDTRSTPRPASLDGGPASLAPRYARLVDAATPDADQAEQARAVGAIYAAQFAPQQEPPRLGQLGDRDVQLLFRAAARTFEATADSARLDDMRWDLAQLERHGAADRPHYAAFYRALLTAHRNEEAKAWLAGHPVLQRSPPPELHDNAVPPGVPSLWVASAGKRELSRQPFALDAPAQVIVLSVAGCHFWQNAARDIEADAALRELFRQHARWVAPAQEIADFDAVQAWNKAHPAQPLAIAADNAEWPMFRVLETPTFYFYRHGELVDTVVGWPNVPALRRAMHEVGLAQ